MRPIYLHWDKINYSQRNICSNTQYCKMRVQKCDRAPRQEIQHSLNDGGTAFGPPHSLGPLLIYAASVTSSLALRSHMKVSINAIQHIFPNFTAKISIGISFYTTQNIFLHNWLQFLDTATNTNHKVTISFVIETFISCKYRFGGRQAVLWRSASVVRCRGDDLPGPVRHCAPHNWRYQL